MDNKRKYSPSKKSFVQPICSPHHLDGTERFFDKTCQMKVHDKPQIKLCSTTRNELAWLLKQYDQVVPTWLRKKFIINQFRRKTLNSVFCESQLDGIHCERLVDKNDWSTSLHLAWHQINEVKPCR